MSYGCQSMTGKLERVLVRPPQAADAARWREYGWRAEPDPAAAAAEHEALCGLLEAAGAEVIVASGEDGQPGRDLHRTTRCSSARRAPSCFDRARPAVSASRTRSWTTWSGPACRSRPASRRPATIDGGDTVWLDERTLLVGRGYRTNASGVEQLAAAFPDAEVLRTTCRTGTATAR